MNAPIPAVAGVSDREVEAFLVREARLLDDRKFEEWMALFVPEGYYWAPARIGQASPRDEVSLIFDDREFMQNRIRRLRHPKVYGQQPASRAVRQVSNVVIDERDAATGEIEVRSVFFMFEHRPMLPAPLQRVFAGEYRHRLRPDGESFRMVWKKALLANCDSSFEPIFLYF
ncbi:aromatic-ring-hydroxylating dioxygenase subunit beta [Pigmentiphaga soli]|uniref:Aromatic-ring-hydroxylating dioxygenase subunit beta n=1 Tax=Pigmentiphaga soli TaxID=1007095 RepID=A0ABP8HBS5_9BURK